MRKYTRLFPYVDTCNDNHSFKEIGKIQQCTKCQWIKYEEEIEGERQLMRRIERVKRRVEIKTKHISLFQF